MGTILLVHVDPTTLETLRGAVDGRVLREISPDQAPRAVEGANGSVDAVVLGPHVPDSPRLAGRVHMRDPQVEVLLLIEKDVPDDLQGRLVAEGLPADRVRGHSLKEPPALAAEVRKAVHATARRRAGSGRALPAEVRAEIGAERARLEALFENAPIPAAWLHGPDHVAEYGNAAMRELYGGRWRQLAGLPARTAVPEVAEQGYFALLDYVFESADPFVGNELPVRLDRHGTGELVEGYYTFIFQPTRAASGRTNGILLLGVEVTDQAVARERMQELAEAAATERDRLRQIVETIPEGILLADTTFNVTESNRAAQDILGRVLTDMREFHEYGIRRADGSEVDPRELPLARAIREGRVVRGDQLLMRNLATNEDLPVLVNAAPLRNKSGQITGAVAAFQDISRMKAIEGELRGAVEARDQSIAARDQALLEAEAARRRVHFLLEASTLLGTVLDLPSTLHRLARIAVPFLGDLCLIDMLQADGSVRRMAAVAADPANQLQASLLRERHAPDPRTEHPILHVIRTGASAHASELPEEFLGPEDGEHRAIMRELGATSYLSVPLTARGRIIGAITLVSTSSRRRYSLEDVDLAEDLARRAALAVDNARLYGERLHVARTLQASLLPRELPQIPGVEIAARYHASGEGNEVGGDFYDLFDTGDGAWGIVMGDVCGKGAEAAAVTGLARYTVRAAAMRQRRPSRIMQTLNDALRQQRDDGRFCTVAYVRWRRTELGARITVCCGGHPPPLILRADGGVEPVGGSGTLLGVFPDPDLADRVADLGPGDSVMLYTDGVIGARGRGTVLSEEEVALVLSSCAGENAGHIADRVETLVLDFQQGDLRDDVALLVLRVTP